MTDRIGIKKAIAGALVVGALSLTSVLGGAAHADGPRVSEIVVTKLSDSTSPKLHDGDVDGRDFLVWQRGQSHDDGGTPTETLSMNFDKIR